MKLTGDALWKEEDGGSDGSDATYSRSESKLGLDGLGRAVTCVDGLR